MSGRQSRRSPARAALTFTNPTVLVRIEVPPRSPPVPSGQDPLGGGLHSTSGDGWAADVVTAEWPNERVILSSDGGAHKGEPGGTWWHILHSSYSTLRTAGFSPTGRTLAVATSSDLTLWTRPSPSGGERWGRHPR